MALVTTCTTYSGYDYSHCYTTLEYLKDINVGLTRFYKDVLAKQEELDKDDRIPKSLQNARPVRNLAMNTAVEFTSDKWISTLLGLFITVSGIEKTFTPYITCDKGAIHDSRRFGVQTFVADDAYKGDLKRNYRKSCSSCMFNSSMTRCGLH